MKGIRRNGNQANHKAICDRMNDLYDNKGIRIEEKEAPKSMEDHIKNPQFIVLIVKNGLNLCEVGRFRTISEQ